MPSLNAGGRSQVFHLENSHSSAVAYRFSKGEVHALDYSKVCPGKKRIYVPLEPHTSFVSKIELKKAVASVLSLVRIHVFCPILGHGLLEDRELCPVRALEIYLSKTQDLQQDRKLFVSYKAGHNLDLHKNTFSS